MQKKVGIRLRHLEGPNQNIHPLDAPSQGRKRERSPSPMNRRKIFPQNIQQEFPSQPHQRARETDHHMKIASPIMNHPFNSNNTSYVDTGSEYESEIERLIQSLKKKTVELQRKDELIIKMKNQIDLLKAQNDSFAQQIRTLKVQVQFQKRNSNQILQNTHNPYSNNPQSKISSKSTQNFYESKNNYKVQQTYQNQPYQEFGQRSRPRQQKINSRISYNNNNQKDEHKVKRSKLQQQEQSSVVSDYLSPLMVLNSDALSKENSGTYRKKQKNQTPPKGSSRTEYQNVQNNEKNPPFSYIDESRNKMMNEHAQNINKKAFSKKYPEEQYLPTYGVSSMDRNQQHRNMLESSAAHFNYNQRQIKRQGSNKNNLAIDDSKQFKFQDFDFSELDNSLNSRF